MDDGKKFVKEARAYLGLTPAGFAERLGVKRHTIWRFERGDPVPKTTRLAIERLLIEHERTATKRAS